MGIYATNSVLAEVACERILQDRKWGEQNHTPEIWLAILIEEVGELATGMLRTRFPDRKYHHRDSDVMRTEAIQVAAVAVALVECLDRKDNQANR